MRCYLPSLALLLLGCLGVTGQSFDKLSKVDGHRYPCYFSEGSDAKADEVSGRISRALSFHQHLLEFSPSFSLLVLAKSDWAPYAETPVYGMPHFSTNRLLIVAAEDNDFWRSFLDQVDALSPDLQAEIKASYTSKDGSLSVQPFFDLLAVHELGHAFHLQGGLQMQRMWMGELFANILLHTYVAENEPESLPALHAFPKMVVSAGAAGYTFTSLKDVHERYAEIGRHHPNNYGWYQSRWHLAAGSIYDVAGKEVCRKLWDALRKQQRVLSDDELVEFLSTEVHPTLGSFIRNWDRETVK